MASMIDNRSIFQAPVNKAALITLFDVKDAFGATRKMTFKDKRAYFESVGIDYDRAYHYYDKVIRLNELYNKRRFKM